MAKIVLAKNSPIILGIDPGFDRLGWAVGQVLPDNAIELIDCNSIQTAKSQTIFERYNTLRLELEKILVTYQPTAVAIESLFFAKNQKTAMQVSEARGLILSSVLRFNCAVTEYTPLQIKQAVTGFGRADKSAVDKMVRLQLKLDDKKVLDDTMDALAILLTHCTQLNLQRRLQ